MNPPFPTSSRRVAFAALVVLLTLVGLVAAMPASASSTALTKAKGCAADVVNDWYAHKTKVVGHYPLHCYREAIDSLGSDIGDYTNAAQIIAAAGAAEALRCKTNCGPTGGGPESSKILPGEKPIARHNTYDFGFPPPDKGIKVVPVSSSSPSSVPLPLIVLAALAGVLLLAGAGSWIARRLKASRAVPAAPDASS
jgi:hypothetical protein